MPTANGGQAPQLNRPHLALGYVEDFLPSFSLPPAKLDDLRIIYGSCRRPANEHPDAMAMIDDVIDAGKLYEDPLKRPHQLVLGGDQIYADDVWSATWCWSSALANELIGTYKGDTSLPAERRSLDRDRDDRLKRCTARPKDPLDISNWAAGGTDADPVDLIAFPAGRRRNIVLRERR